jgi:hypothetical protein
MYEQIIRVFKIELISGPRRFKWIHIIFIISCNSNHLKIGLRISIATSAGDLADLIPPHVNVIVYTERTKSHVILISNLKMIYRRFKRLVRDYFPTTSNQRAELMNWDMVSNKIVSGTFSNNTFSSLSLNRNYTTDA